MTSNTLFLNLKIGNSTKINQNLNFTSKYEVTVPVFIKINIHSKDMGLTGIDREWNL